MDESELQEVEKAKYQDVKNRMRAGGWVDDGEVLYVVEYERRRR